MGAPIVVHGVLIQDTFPDPTQPAPERTYLFGPEFGHTKAEWDKALAEAEAVMQAQIPEVREFWSGLRQESKSLLVGRAGLKASEVPVITRQVAGGLLSTTPPNPPSAETEPPRVVSLGPASTGLPPSVVDTAFETMMQRQQEIWNWQPPRLSAEEAERYVSQTIALERNTGQLIGTSFWTQGLQHGAFRPVKFPPSNGMTIPTPAQGGSVEIPPNWFSAATWQKAVDAFKDLFEYQVTRGDKMGALATGQDYFAAIKSLKVWQVVV